MANYKEFDYGSTVRLACDFRVDNVLTDPSTISLQVEDPNGTINTYTYAGATVSKLSTGRYYKDVACSVSGEWEQEWTGTGSVEAVDHSRFMIRRQGV